MKIEMLASEKIKSFLDRPLQKYESQYWGFYSSIWGGVSLDPRLLMIPLDDHMVHRGDGVFEALKVTERRIFLLQPHLERLLKSAEMISLKHNWTKSGLSELVKETVRMVLAGREGNPADASVRLFLTRGSGSFGTSPLDSSGSQFFAAFSSKSGLGKRRRPMIPVA